jgi:hypothetical protein
MEDYSNDQQGEENRKKKQPNMRDMINRKKNGYVQIPLVEFILLTPSCMLITFFNN